MLLLLVVKSSGIGEGGTATRVGRRKDRVGEDDLTDNIPIGAKEALSLGLLGEESRLDLILQSKNFGVKFSHLGEALGLSWPG